jgi:hypothetical protein
MPRTKLLVLSLLALFIPHFISRGQQPAAPSARAGGVGTIQGSIVRLGTSDPIPEVQIAFVARGGMTAQEAQTVITLHARGPVFAAAIPPEALENARDAARSGLALTAVADSSGQFTIRDVPAGVHTLRAQLEGYFGAETNGAYPATVDLPVTVKAGETQTVKISMLPGGTVSGRVLDPSNKPLSDAAVQILQMGYENGVRSPRFVDSRQTDDRGEYRLYQRPPGEYYVAATPHPLGPLLGARGSEDVQVPTFYPAAMDISQATRVTLRSGEEVSGIDIRITAVATVKISGRVTSTAPAGAATGANGQPRLGSVVLVRRDLGGQLPSSDLGNVISLPADGGPFVFEKVVPGMYEVIARMPVGRGGGWGTQAPPDRANAPWAFGTVSVDARTRSVDDLAVIVQPGTNVKGRVLLDGMPARANIGISLQPETNPDVTDQQTGLVLHQIRQYVAPINDDGSFLIPLVPEGRYRFQVRLNPGPTPTQLPAGAYLADIRAGDTSVYDNGLRVGGGSPGDIEILVNSSGGSLDGTVAGSDLKPAQGATAVLVPPENRRQNAALYRVARSDTQGRFTMTSIVPGRYTLYAWESVPVGAYQNAEFLAKFAGQGVAVVVQAGGISSVSVSAIRATSTGR